MAFYRPKTFTQKVRPYALTAMAGISIGVWWDTSITAPITTYTINKTSKCRNNKIASIHTDDTNPFNDDIENIEYNDDEINTDEVIDNTSYKEYVAKTFPRMVDENMSIETMKVYLGLSESEFDYSRKSCTKSTRDAKTVSGAFGFGQIMPSTNKLLDKRLGITSNTWSVPNQDRKIDYLLNEYKDTLVRNNLPVNLLNVMAIHVFGNKNDNAINIINGEITKGELFKRVIQHTPKNTYASSLPRASMRWYIAFAEKLDRYRTIAEGTIEHGKWKGTKRIVKYAFDKVMLKWKDKGIYISRFQNNPAENKNRGGVSHSQHIVGLAIDIKVTSLSGLERQMFLTDLINHGFKGIGVGPTTIHADMRNTKKTNFRIARWSYFKDKKNKPTYPKWATKVFVACN